MHVMYGKRGYNGKLGAFVARVDKDGPADSYGIRQGTLLYCSSVLDCLLEGIAVPYWIVCLKAS